MTEMQPPKLTLRPAEAKAVRDAYRGARVILEYGSGGSTVLAGAVAGAQVYSVESDAAWVAMMQGWFAANPPQAQVTLHHADIGRTKEWGMPVNHRQVMKWPGYANSIWGLEGFSQPDIVLIDGRFRLACFLTTLFKTEAPVKVLWDDYTKRPGYHLAERLAKPVAMHGRMAEFLLTRQTLDPNELDWVTRAYVTPH